MAVSEYPRLDAPKKSKKRGTTKKIQSPTDQYAEIASEQGDEAAALLLRQVAARMDSQRTEMSRFQTLCRRWDNLYYPDVITEYGADHWPEDPNRSIPGRSHVSVNSYPVYVDVPAALQSATPIENIAPADPRQEQNRELAASVERVFFAWKDQTSFELKAHKACVTKGLYGRTAAKVWWDPDLDMPQFSVIDQPGNLWMGFSSSDYNVLEWVVYSKRLHPDAVVEQYGIEVAENDEGFPYIRPGSQASSAGTGREGPTRSWLASEHDLSVEVIDYWFRRPNPDKAIVEGERTEMQTCNAILVGNRIVKNEVHDEYDGMLPYVPLYNTYVPGVPDGRSEFFDIEQLLREKDERMTAGATMLSKTVGGQFWQLTGPEAPDKVPSGLSPQPDKVVAPGAGNRIEAITPWLPEYQLNDYLGRLDREISDVSGLNDLLRGLAPAQVLSSGKAINALIANYEARIRLKRALFYDWRKGIWNLATQVWGHHNSELGDAFSMASELVITPPSLTPRDELETATLAANNMNSKLWSIRRGMDVVGVEDPEAEIDVIKEERTDAALHPADVQVQVALLAQLQQMQLDLQTLQQQLGVPSAGGGMGAPLDQLSQQAAMSAPTGQPQMNDPSQIPALPPEALSAGAPPPGSMPMGGPMGDMSMVNQGMVKDGEAQNRILFEQDMSPEEGV